MPTWWIEMPTTRPSWWAMHIPHIRPCTVLTVLYSGLLYSRRLYCTVFCSRWTSACRLVYCWWINLGFETSWLPPYVYHYFIVGWCSQPKKENQKTRTPSHTPNVSFEKKYAYFLANTKTRRGNPVHTFASTPTTILISHFVLLAGT